MNEKEWLLLMQVALSEYDSECLIVSRRGDAATNNLHCTINFLFSIWCSPSNWGQEAEQDLQDGIYAF